jgi:hypothetical protein
VRGSPTPEFDSGGESLAPVQLPPIIYTGPGYISLQLLHTNSPLAVFARQDAAIGVQDLISEQNERRAARLEIQPSPEDSQDERRRNASRPGSYFDPEAEDAESDLPLPRMNDETIQREQILSLEGPTGVRSYQATSANHMNAL